MYLILRFFKDMDIEDGKFLIKGSDRMKDIKSKFPELDVLKAAGVKKTVGVFIDKQMGESKARDLKLVRISLEESTATFYYIAAEEMEFTSGKLNSSLYGLLIRKGVINRREYTPYIAILDDNDWNSLIRSCTGLRTEKYRDDEEKLAALKRDNNWEAIYKYFGPIDGISEGNHEIWNEPSILKEIGFAASKLAPVGSIPRDIRNDKAKRDSLLAIKRMYRQDTEKVYKRCIELLPDDASSYSNLGFFYYNNVLDLTTQGGRRDGNAKEEFDKAEGFISRALNIDGSRIKDLYRIGYLYTEKLPGILQFSGKKESENEENKYVKEAINKGITYFDRIIELWEEFDDENEIYSRKKSFRRDYLKAQFNRGKAYQSHYEKYWNRVFNSSILFNIPVHEIRPLYKSEQQCIERAKESYERCFFTECAKKDVIDNEDLSYINAELKNWKLEAVDMLYRLGTIYFDIYWSLVSTGPSSRMDRDEYLKKAKSYIDMSEKCLSLSLKVRWNEKGNQSRKHIEERLARLYISSGRYKEAVKLLARYSHSKDYYIINTLCLGYYLEGENNKAADILKETAKDKYNLVIHHSKMLLAMCLFNMESYSEARTILKVIYEEYKRIPSWESRLKELIEECERKA